MAPLIKCVVLGNAQAGKTSLVCSYIGKSYKSNPASSIYMEYAIKTTTSSGSLCKLILCDITGVADEYSCIKRLYYPNTDVFLICFSVVDAEFSKDSLEHYVSDIRTSCPNVQIVLVGTKVDLRDDEEFLNKWHVTAISNAQGRKLAKEIGAIAYMECSALKGTSVRAVFDVAAMSGLYYQKNSRVKKRSFTCSLM